MPCVGDLIFIQDLVAKDGKKPAAVVTEHLAVSRSNEKLDTNTFKVYCVSNNQALLKCRTTTFDAAKALAEWIEAIYGDYLSIYDVYPDWDVLSIARWSMPGGCENYAEMAELEGIITLEQIKRARDKANELVR